MFTNYFIPAFYCVIIINSTRKYIIIYVKLYVCDMYVYMCRLTVQLHRDISG